MGSSKRAESRADSTKLKNLGKMAKILGYIIALFLLGVAIYWFTIPGGWLIGIGFLIAAVWVGIEAWRAIKT